MSSDELEFARFQNSQRRISELEAALAERDAVICGLREALTGALAWIEADETTHGRTFGCGNIIRKALSAAPECPHEKKAKELKEVWLGTHTELNEKIQEQAALMEKMREKLVWCASQFIDIAGTRVVVKEIDEFLRDISAPDALAEVKAEARREALEEAAKVPEIYGCSEICDGVPCNTSCPTAIAHKIRALASRGGGG